MLVTLQEIIGMPEKGGYCIPAFNVYNVETIMGVLEAAQEAKAPVIIQVYPRLINEQVGYYISPAVNEMQAAVEAAKIARENGTKVLYDCGGLYDGVEKLLALTDIMIPSDGL